MRGPWPTVTVGASGNSIAGLPWSLHHPVAFTQDDVSMAVTVVGSTQRILAVVRSGPVHVHQALLQRPWKYILFDI